MLELNRISLKNKKKTSVVASLFCLVKKEIIYDSIC